MIFEKKLKSRTFFWEEVPQVSASFFLLLSSSFLHHQPNTFPQVLAATSPQSSTTSALPPPSRRSSLPPPSCPPLPRAAGPPLLQPASCWLPAAVGPSQASLRTLGLLPTLPWSFRPPLGGRTTPRRLLQFSASCRILQNFCITSSAFFASSEFLLAAGYLPAALLRISYLPFLDSSLSNLRTAPLQSPSAPLQRSHARPGRRSRAPLLLVDPFATSLRPVSALSPRPHCHIILVCHFIATSAPTATSSTTTFEPLQIDVKRRRFVLPLT